MHSDHNDNNHNDDDVDNDNNHCNVIISKVAVHRRRFGMYNSKLSRFI